MDSSTSSASSPQESASDSLIPDDSSSFAGKSRMGTVIEFLIKLQSFMMFGILVYLIYEYSSKGDGKWSDWGSWSPCKDGLSKRSRNCTNPPLSIFWRNCQGDPVEYKTCDFFSCKGFENRYSDTQRQAADMNSEFLSTLAEVSQRIEKIEVNWLQFEEHDNLINKHEVLLDKEFNVGFTAWNLKTSTISDDILQFRRTDLNNGNAYSTETGIFTCPLAGVYHFSFTLTKHYKSITALGAYLKINGDEKLYLALDKYERIPLTMSGTYHLNKNDIVYVNSVPDYFFADRYSQFSGYLITPD